MSPIMIFMVFIGVFTIACAGIRYLIAFDIPTKKELGILVYLLFPGVNIIALGYFAITLYNVKFSMEHE